MQFSKILSPFLITISAVASAAPYCGDIPSTTPPANAVPVRTFGAVLNDGIDDTAALQRAFDAGGTLVLEPGQYLISNQVKIRKAGTSIYGPGATIHGTNPDSQSLTIEADNTGVYGLRFTAVTDIRRTAPWHTRIAVYKESAGVAQTVRNVTIVGNIIAPVDSVNPNAASAGGIIVRKADGFLVAGNTVARTLADGIHITAGSRNGRVISNTVRENGDDMIAVVSYATGGEAALNTAAAMASDWEDRKYQLLTQNVLIANNQVAGNYWGRGITVVGGKDITIDSNTITNVPIGAGVLLAREAPYQTFGVSNVLVQNNQLSQIQTSRSPYDPNGTFATKSRTGHGAYEVHASLWLDETTSPIRGDLAVRDVAFVGNVLNGANIPAIRVGVDSAGTRNFTPDGGVQVSRSWTTGDVAGVSTGPAPAATGSQLKCQQ